jgi:hypothetical protein
MTSGRDNRTFRGMWVYPKAQLILCALLSMGFIVLGLLQLVLLRSFHFQLDALSRAYHIEPEIINMLSNDLSTPLKVATIISFVLALSGIGVGFVLGHRIYGPMVPIRAHVKKLIDGDYKARVRVRTGDEFKELVQDLNVLAEMLDTKKAT